MSRKNFINEFLKGNVPCTHTLWLDKVLKEFFDNCIECKASDVSIRYELEMFIITNTEVANIIRNI